MIVVHFPEVKDADFNQDQRSLYIVVFFCGGRNQQIIQRHKFCSSPHQACRRHMRQVPSERYLCPFSPAFLKSHNTFFPSYLQTHHEYEAAYTYRLAVITISHTVETVVAVLL